jgi:hypothetical protein
MKTMGKPFTTVGLAVSGALVVAAILLGSSGRNTAEAPAGHVRHSGGVGLPIFFDRLTEGWDQLGWAKSLVWDASDAPRGEIRGGTVPKRTIRVRFDHYDGILLHHEPLDVSSYDRFAFRAHGGARGGQKLRVFAKLSQFPRRDVILDPLPAGTWATIAVPLATMGVEGKPDLTDLCIQDDSGRYKQEPVWIFDIRLLAPEEALPPGVPVTPEAGPHAVYDLPPHPEERDEGK